MNPPFRELRERLLRAGVAPRHVRRYLAELVDHLADLGAEGENEGLSPSDAASAAFARLGGIEALSRAMMERRQFQSWCARAPWAAFAITPLLLLAWAYFSACLILWTGWILFLPGTHSPFIPVDGLANLYFQLGRAIFFGAPVLIGWGVGLVAVRQRFRVFWPTVGLILVSFVGGTARVHASPPAGPAAAGHVSMGLSLGDLVPGITNGLLHALVLLLLTALPYLVWQVARSRPTPRHAYPTQ
jgi:hypothetical protein